MTVAISLRQLVIPFNVTFKHASAERAVTEAVAAIAERGGIRGFGEGCPRSYVTSESVASALDFSVRNRPALEAIDSPGALQVSLQTMKEDIDRNPAAWCAIETALLDLFARECNVSLEKLLGMHDAVGAFRYTAILGVSSPKIFEAQLGRYVALGMSDFKIKVSGDGARDAKNFRLLADRSPAARIRLDANNLWKSADEASFYLEGLGGSFWAIEEPLPAGNLDGLMQIASRLGCRIILDESFLRIEQLNDLLEEPRVWIPNVRISKMGGLLRSWDVARRCADAGMEIVVGAQVGETSILSRLALSLVANSREIVIGQEGAFGTILLERDVTQRPIIFGKGGIVDADFSGRPGLGFDCAID